MENHLNCEFYWSNFCQIYTIVLQSLSFFRARSLSLLVDHLSQTHIEQICKRYHRIPLDFPQILFKTTTFPFSLCSLVSFTFLFSLVSFEFCLCCVCVFLFFYLKQKIYILMNISPCGRVSNKKTTFLAIKDLTYFRVVAKNISYFGIYKNIVLHLF